MKNIKLYLFSMATIGILFISSGCDSDSEDEPKIQTFLEKYDGVLWEDRTGDYDYYFMFRNDLSNLILEWDETNNYGPVCFEYYEVFKDYRNDDFEEDYIYEVEILENLNNQLKTVVTMTEFWEGEVEDIWNIESTIEVINDKLIVTQKSTLVFDRDYPEDVGEFYEDNDIYFKSTIDINDLNICSENKNSPDKSRSLQFRRYLFSNDS